MVGSAGLTMTTFAPESLKHVYEYRLGVPAIAMKVVPCINIFMGQ